MTALLEREKYLSFDKTCLLCYEVFRGTMENHRCPQSQDKELTRSCYTVKAHVFFTDKKSGKVVDFETPGGIYYHAESQSTVSVLEPMKPKLELTQDVKAEAPLAKSLSELFPKPMGSKWKHTAKIVEQSSTDTQAKSV